MLSFSPRFAWLRFSYSCHRIVWRQRHCYSRLTGTVEWWWRRWRSDLFECRYPSSVYTSISPAVELIHRHLPSAQLFLFQSGRRRYEAAALRRPDWSQLPVLEVLTLRQCSPSVGIWYLDCRAESPAVATLLALWLRRIPACANSTRNYYFTALTLP